MDAVIMAAGLGTRLRPHTLTTPKPLLPVRGRPILDWLLGALPPVGRVAVVVNHLSGQIEDYLKAQTHVPAGRWAAVRQAEPRGTGDAFKSCAGAIESGAVMVINGDDLYGRADLANLAAAGPGLLARPVDDPRKFGVVFRKGDGTLDRLVEKPDMGGPQLANIGAYLFPSEALGYDLPLSPRGEYEITDVVSRVAADRPFAVVPADFWLPIGTVEAWEAAQRADLSPL